MSLYPGIEAGFQAILPRPAFYLSETPSLFAGGTFTRSVSFTDPGADTWTATVDYDDGSGPQPLVLTGNQFSRYHHYLLPGEYTLTVVVTDDDGGAGSSSISIQVTGYRILLPAVFNPAS